MIIIMIVIVTYKLWQNESSLYSVQKRIEKKMSLEVGKKLLFKRMFQEEQKEEKIEWVQRKVHELRVRDTEG